jgi:hypothetical protein
MDDCTNKDYVDLRIAELEKRIILQFRLNDEATVRQHHELEGRLEGLNQLRQEYTQDRAKDNISFVRQENYDLKIGGIDLWMISANQNFTKLMTKYDSRFTVPTVISAVAVIISMIGLVLMYFKH